VAANRSVCCRIVDVLTATQQQAGPFVNRRHLTGVGLFYTVCPVFYSLIYCAALECVQRRNGVLAGDDCVFIL